MVSRPPIVQPMDVTPPAASGSPSDLGQAVIDGFARGEFSVVYQPLVAVDDTETVAFEALTRWHSPRFGTVSPNEFIPAAESSGAIHGLGRWVLEEACRQLMVWREEFPFRNLSVSVNVSAEQLLDPDFELIIREVLVLTGVDPRALQIEVTQAVLERAPDVVAGRIRFMRRVGIRIALDDLAPENIPLWDLADLEVDVIKIDRAFIDRLTSAGSSTRETLVALVDAAHERGIVVSAEGVENEQQLEELLAERVEFAQGFFFARPLDAANVLDFLASEESLPAEL